MTGSSAFAKQFASAGVPINFDVRWVTTGAQWEVNAYKTPPGTPVEQYHQTVAFSTRTINLYTSKLVRYTAANDAGVAGPNFSSTPHEFGHALGNPDEYVAGSAHLHDSSSTMNVGRELRARHLTLVLGVLNTMISGSVFSM